MLSKNKGGEKIVAEDIIRDRKKEEYISIKNEVKFNLDACNKSLQKILNDIFLIVDLSSTGIFDEMISCTNLPSPINSIILSYMAEVGRGGNPPLSFFDLHEDYEVKDEDRIQLAKMERIERIEEQMILNDEGFQLMTALQNIFGYMLTGHIDAEKYWIFYNKQGRAGKGLIMNALQFIMGEYFGIAERNLFVDKSLKAPSSQSNFFLKMLNKSRIAWCDDIKNKLDQTLIKHITEKSSTIAKSKNQLKLLICTTIPPESVKYDNTMWERTEMLLFPAVFVETKNIHAIYHRQMDCCLKEKIRSEEFKSSFLNWVLEGSINYYKTGRKVETGSIVQNVTQAYRASTDSYIRWKLSCLEKDRNTDTKLSIAECFQNYQTFCKTISETEFSEINPQKIKFYGREKFCIKIEEEFRKSEKNERKSTHIFGYKFLEKPPTFTKFIDEMIT